MVHWMKSTWMPRRRCSSWLWQWAEIIDHVWTAWEQECSSSLIRVWDVQLTFVLKDAKVKQMMLVHTQSHTHDRHTQTHTAIARADGCYSIVPVPSLSLCPLGSGHMVDNYYLCLVFVFCDKLLLLQGTWNGKNHSTFLGCTKRIGVYTQILLDLN